MSKRPSRHDLRLVPAAALTWISAIWAVGVPAWSALGAALGLAAGCGLSWVTLILLGLRFPVNAKLFTRSLLLIALAFGVSSVALGNIAIKQHSWESSLLYSAAQGSQYVTVTATVTADPRESTAAPTSAWQEARWLAQLTTATVEYRGKMSVQKAPITLLGGDELARVRAGYRVAVSGKIQETTPGDASRVLLFGDSSIQIIDHGSGVTKWGASARDKFRSGTDSLPDKARGLIPGMVIGDTSDIPESTKQAFKDTSLTHLTAVSGAHCTVIIGAALALARPPRNLRPRSQQVFRIGVAGAVLTGFVIVTGPQPSVLRASLMGAVGLIGLARGRRSKALAALAVAVIVLLLFSPWLARDYGFAMSVISTAAIVAAAGPVTNWLRAHRIPHPLALALAVSSSAQVACLPVLLVLDPRLPMYALLANIVATPLFPLVSLPGVAGLVLALVFPPLSALPLWVAAVPATAIGWVAEIIARLPGATIRWPPPVEFWVIGALFVAVLWAGYRHKEGLRAHRVWAVCGVALALSALAALLVSGAAQKIGDKIAGRMPIADWFYVQCDVGQGDSAVLRARSGEVVLVDVGLPDGRAATCLNELGVKEIDFLVLTHWHQDHVGGLEQVLEEVSVETALIPSWSEPHDTAAAALRVLNDRGVAAWQARAGQAIGTRSGALRGQVVWPTARALELMPQGAADGTSVNDLSTVVLFEIATATGTVEVAMLGDLEESGQRGLLQELVAENKGVGVDVVKVAHHGSRSQLSELTRWLAPRAAVIGVGKDNDYGHPSPVTVGSFEQAGSRIAATSLHGQIRIGTAGGGTSDMGAAQSELFMMFNTGATG